MDVKVNNLIVNIQSQFNFIIKPVQKVKLEIFIKIWVLRVMNKCPLKEAIIPEENLSPEIKQHLKSIAASVKNAFNLDLPDNELNYLYTFLVTQQYLPGIQEILDDQHFSMAYELTDQLIESLQAASRLIEVERLDIPKLRQTLNAVHLKFTTFYVEPTTFIRFSKIKLFKESYPVFHTIINDFMTTLNQRNDLNLSRQESANLYLDYMFTFINCIPQKLQKFKIYICVDFSLGPLYTDYIIKTLQESHNANFVLTRNLSAQTDIYLSDFLTSSVKQQQVIWHNPPSHDDWETLTDTINQIKYQKVRALRVEKQNEELE
ncbi:hypothetical protein IWT25_01747 [Secundilactobacillus pentosiphilus]|uniref:PRD domain-containing protein n=1 Tax=Secundilactobacillus pentosiphilus TaxID=1714682 RepID=A0A1Z5IXA5_9LACO|nr:hypothetical protein [Secundilactobacillus pentosiphilus]GAX06403.1 hypothetical protein IWT25_01747 [Secundilactobacillus pentosiphilus]